MRRLCGLVILVILWGCGQTSTSTKLDAGGALDAKEMTSFAFRSADNANLPSDAIGTINGTQVSITLAPSTEVTTLKATFDITGASVSVAGVPQTSHISANDFTSPVRYDVTARDGSFTSYTVSVTVETTSAKDIIGFSFLTTDNPGLPLQVTGAIAGTSIIAKVPAGTDRGSLVASFSTTGATITVAGAPQTSGLTPNDFTSPLTYLVTASDGSTKQYTVSVGFLSTDKVFTSFQFLAVNNAGLTDDVSAQITGNSVTATVPFGTSVAALRASFVAPNATVRVMGLTQVSGSTPNNFTQPALYRVTAEDGSFTDYNVTLSIGLNPSKDITTFGFQVTHNAGLSRDVAGIIAGTLITIAVPYGTNVGALVPTFTSTGASVAVAGAAQMSGITSQDFRSSRIYRVTAADGSSRDFVVRALGFSTRVDFTNLVQPGQGQGRLGGAIAIADLNGDGVPDLAGTSTQSVWVRLNITAAGVTTPNLSPRTDFAVPPGTIPTAIASGDLNGDGKPDLATADSSGGSVSVFLNTTPLLGTSPTFSPRFVLSFTPGPTDLVFGDFNLDGRLDLAVANTNNNTSNVVSVILNTTPQGATTPTFATPVSLVSGANPSDVVAGDFDQDGRLDLAALSTSAGTVSVFMNETVGGADTAVFSTKTDFGGGGSSQGLSVVDVNGDGAPELVAAGRFLINGTVAGSGVPVFTPIQVPDAPFANHITFGDVNADGKPNIVETALAFQNSGIVVLFNTTPVGSTTLSFVKASYTDAISQRSLLLADVEVADLNSDGRLDVVTTNKAGTLVVLVNTTDSNVEQLPLAPPQPVSIPASHLALGDLGADPDLHGSRGPLRRVV